MTAEETTKHWTESKVRVLTEVPINSIAVGDRKRPVNAEFVAELAEDIKRRGLMHPIAVRARAGGGYDLAAGHHRMLAVAKILSTVIDCFVYPAAMSDAEVEEMEIVENLKRLDLTQDERHLHRVELAALLKEQDGEQPILDKDVELPKKRGGGRGKKGMVQKVAEAEGVAHTAVRHSAEVVGELAGEPVDLERDTAADLKRKVTAAKTAPQPRGKRRDPQADSYRAALRKIEPSVGADVVERIKAGQIKVSTQDVRDIALLPPEQQAAAIEQARREHAGERFAKEPVPKRATVVDPRDAISQALAAIPKKFDAAAWAADMPGFLRKNTAANCRELRARLIVLEVALGGADRILEPEQAGKKAD